MGFYIRIFNLCRGEKGGNGVSAPSKASSDPKHDVDHDLLKTHGFIFCIFKKKKIESGRNWKK